MRAVQLGVVSRGESCANYNYARKEGRLGQYCWVLSHVVRAVPTITYSMLGRREGEDSTAGCCLTW